jgi:hypothetical protein
MSEEVQEVIEDIELEEIEGLDTIEYHGKSLDEWVTILTIDLPKLPCGAHEMGNAVISITNAYGKAYNAFNTLLVLCSKAENQYKAEKFRLIDVYLVDCKKKNLKPPSKENVEIIVINQDKNKKVRMLMERYKIYDMIKSFFENNTKKLEKTLSAAKELLYISGAHSRVEHKGNI